MAAFQASVNAMPMAWLLAGQAIRVAQDLGLHVRSCVDITVLLLIPTEIYCSHDNVFPGETAAGSMLVGDLRSGTVRLPYHLLLNEVLY